MGRLKELEHFRYLKSVGTDAASLSKGNVKKSMDAFGKVESIKRLLQAYKDHIDQVAVQRAALAEEKNALDEAEAKRAAGEPHAEENHMRIKNEVRDREKAIDNLMHIIEEADMETGIDTMTKKVAAMNTKMKESVSDAVSGADDLLNNCPASPLVLDWDA